MFQAQIISTESMAIHPGRDIQKTDNFGRKINLNFG